MILRSPSNIFHNNKLRFGDILREHIDCEVAICFVAMHGSKFEGISHFESISFHSQDNLSLTLRERITSQENSS